MVSKMRLQLIISFKKANFLVKKPTYFHRYRNIKMETCILRRKKSKNKLQVYTVTGKFYLLSTRLLIQRHSLFKNGVK